MVNRFRFRRLSRQQRRTLAVFVLYAAVALAALFHQQIGALTAKDLYENIVTGAVVAALIALPLGVGYILWQRHRNKQRSELRDFAHAPWLYEKGGIEITGRIEHVFSDRVSKKLRLFFTDLYRKLVASGDFSSRYLHQRCLISSPHLLPGENIMVIHNTKFGQLDLKDGRWLHVKGEYLHRRAPRLSKRGRKLTFYGLIHFTHEPRGLIEVLDQPPATPAPPIVTAFLSAESAQNLEETTSSHDDPKPKRRPRG